MYFNTVTEKITHINLEHHCPFKQRWEMCKFSAEYQSQMDHHITSEHNTNVTCQLCGSVYETSETLQSHILHSHIKCVTCQEYFLDYKALQVHNTPIECMQLHQMPKIKKDLNNFIDPKTSISKPPEIDGTDCLTIAFKEMLKTIDMDKSSKECIERNLTQWTISQRQFLDHSSKPHLPSIEGKLLLEVPSFYHGSHKENTQRLKEVYQGKNIWAPENGQRNAWPNLLSFATIYEDVLRAVKSCYLTESTATDIIIRQLSPQVRLNIEARTKTECKNLSLIDLLSAIQKSYFMLNLKEVRESCLNLIKLRNEPIMEFFGRAHQMLKYCAIDLPPTEKANYIETSLKSLMMRNIKPETKAEIESLQHKYNVPYSALDILDNIRAKELANHPLRPEVILDSLQIQTARIVKKARKTTSKINSLEIQKPKAIKPKMVNFEKNKTSHASKNEPKSLGDKPNNYQKGQQRSPLKRPTIRDKLKIDPTDKTPFCYTCGAGKFGKRPYHWPSECKLQRSNNTHLCYVDRTGKEVLLMHIPDQCPFARNYSIKTAALED